MTDAIAVLNAGSSSLKFSLYSVHGPGLQRELHGQVESLHTGPRLVAHDRSGVTIADRRLDLADGSGHAGALPHLLGFLREGLAGTRLVAIGHRVVHGGQAHWRPVLVNRDILADLEKLVPLAPLHQPHSLAPIRDLLAREPGLPQVACFDTAFHHGAPEI
ncbi:MAG: acetate kinase, partial [Gammaproteobacteria bacterium]